MTQPLFSQTRKLIVFCLALLCCSTGYAQYTMPAPQPPGYGIVNQPGATIGQVLDAMYAGANPADTGEGGEQDQIGLFKRMWEGRVTVKGEYRLKTV